MEFFGAIIGGLFAALLTASVSWWIFWKQTKIERYLQFVAAIEELWSIQKKKSRTEDDERKILKLLNLAYFNAAIAMNDQLFRKVTENLNGQFSKEKRNRLYWLMRKDVFRRTEVSYEDLIDKDFGFKE